MRHHFDCVTQQIITAVEEGASDYSLPWHRHGASLDLPANSVTQKRYRGLNIVSLWLQAENLGYSSGDWASYRQWASVGAQVLKGEKGTPIFFWMPSKHEENEEAKPSDNRMRGYVARTYHVFNRDQVENAPPTLQSKSNDLHKHPDAESFFDQLGAQVIHGGDRACYIPSRDTIHMPNFDQFRSAEAYYSVRAHETVHWTGAKNRLDRDLTNRFGTEAYGMEELIAELGAAFLCSALKISLHPRRDHAAYIASWLKVMRSDNKAFLTAASSAQAALDYLCPDAS